MDSDDEVSEILRDKRTLVKKAGGSILWVPLPSNIAWTKRLNGALTAFMADPWMSMHYRSAFEGCDMPKIRFAWRLSDKNHEQTVRMITSKTMAAWHDRKVEVEVEQAGKRKRIEDFAKRLKPQESRQTIFPVRAPITFFPPAQPIPEYNRSHKRSKFKF